MSRPARYNHSRFPSMGIKKWYEQWLKPRPGSIYLAVTIHPDTWHPNGTGRECTGYVGKTQRRDHHIRWDEHEFGTRDKGPQPWIDTLVRWEILFTSRRVRGITLAWLEWWHIKRRRPLYNWIWNQDNKRMIPPSVAVKQRKMRDALTAGGQAVPLVPSYGASRQPSQRRSSRVPVMWLLPWVVLSGIGVLFIPSMPGANFIAAMWDWVGAHGPELGGGLLLLAGGVVVSNWPKTRSRRPVKRRTTTRRRRR